MIKLPKKTEVLTIAYDGSKYHGWQKQKGIKTAESEIEDALERLYNEKISVVASGRTDEGVHALGQVAHFEPPREINSLRILAALNSFLPSSMRVVAVEKKDNFHARYLAKGKTYVYKMYVDNVESPFKAGRSLFLKRQPNVEIMQKAVELFVGTHDFSSFYALGSSAQTTIRSVFFASVTQINKDIELKITANGFLYKMVRMISSAVLRAGQGKITLLDIQNALNGEKPLPKVALDASGLYLLGVDY